MNYGIPDKKSITISTEDIKTVSKPEKDNINPDHYKSSTSLECIEAMEMIFGNEAVYDFCVLNAFKYIWRWKHKNGSEDLDKAKWYLTRSKEEGFSVDNGIINRMQEYIRNIESKNP